MRKLVIYRDDAALRAQASGYPLLWNYKAADRCGELDDGVGFACHVDFRTAQEGASVRGYDAVEVVGISPMDVLWKV